MTMRAKVSGIVFFVEVFFGTASNGRALALRRGLSDVETATAGRAAIANDDWDDDITFGFAYEYLDAGEAEVDQFRGPLAGRFKGE